MSRMFAVFAFLTISCAVIPTPRTYAQTNLGVRAGLNLATFGGEHIADFDHRPALNVGAFLDLPLSGRVGLRVGAGYSGHGAETTFSGGAGETTYEGKLEYRIGYVEVPVALKIRAIQRSRASANLLLGPAFSFKTSCEVEMAAPEWRDTFQCNYAGLNVRPMDLSARTGIGIEARVSQGLMVVGESHYSFGLRTVGSSGDGVKNRGFSMSLGLAFPIG